MAKMTFCTSYYHKGVLNSPTKYNLSDNISARQMNNCSVCKYYSFCSIFSIMANSTFGSRQLSPYMNGRSSHDLPKTPTLQRPSDASRPLPTTPKSEHRQLYKRQSSEAMQSWQKNILRMNSALMKTNLRFDDCLILDELYGKHVISQLNRETLEKMGSRPKDQVSKFLSILERSSEDAYYLFLEVLEQDDSYRYIWQKLVDDERKYHSNLNKVETSYLTPMSTKRSEEQLHVDERRNTYVVVVSTFVPVLSERKIPTLKSKLWDLFHTVVSGDSGNYEAISGSNVPKGAADSIDDLPQGSDDLTLNAKDFLKDYFEPVETQIEKNQQLLLDTDLTDLLVEIFKTGTYFLAYNANRNLLLVENCHVKAYGDISEELWYYPTPVSPKQITVWLAEGRLKGTFYVYRSSNNDPHDPDYAVYNIGLCCNESGDVIHYRIVQNKDNELLIGDVRKNRGMKFDSIQNLVKYFRTTRGCLECRLRWSPRELTEKKVMTSTINVKQLTFQDRVASVSDQNHTSNVYKGFYAGKAVAIKVPAKPPRNKIEEADFLQEAIILGQLSHEHVAKFEGICYTRESWHIVLEYADNNDLHTCLKNDLIDYTNVRTTMNLWMQLLEALVYLRNQAYVIHRDIAARNCLIYGLEVLKV